MTSSTTTGPEASGVIQLKDPYLDGVFPNRPPIDYRFTRVLNELQLPLLVRMTCIPDSRDYVAIGKDGQLIKFSWNSPDKTTVILDITDKTMNEGESGLLDLAFHPQFHNPESPHYREAFLAYNYDHFGELSRNYLRLSRFRFEEDLGSIVPSSEEILIQQFAENPNHNAGDLFFDEEGFLYFSIGDEGGHKNIHDNAQRVSRELFSGILRIDVDNDSSRSHPIRRQPAQSLALEEGDPPSYTQGYSIPNDNPWVDTTGVYLEEFYAIGLRNPYTTFYDSLTSKIWVGDVGQEGQEEITLVDRGSNAQWPYYEGELQQGVPPDSIQGIETPPKVVYGRSEGRAIICGLVYRGDVYPELQERLIFGDFITGNTWYYDEELGEKVLMALGPQLMLQYFQGPDDKVYGVSFYGHVYSLERSEVQDPPALLSETGAFEDLTSLTPTEGLVPYELNSPLWSDAADKRRWVSVPDGQPAGYDRNDPWVFNAGAVFVKHFEMNLGSDSIKRLETRFLVKDELGSAYGVTYRWNEDDTDATLISAKETISDTLEMLNGHRITWNYPTRSQCMECHNQAAAYVLGAKTAQLNRDITIDGHYYASQLDLWQDLRMLDQPYAFGDLPKMSSLHDESATTLSRFKSYIDANCAHCHRPEGSAPQFDARYSTPFAEQGLYLKHTQGFNSVPDNFLITPGDTSNSEFWRRDAAEGKNWQMPPLARNMVDSSYLDVLHQFIADLAVSTEYIEDTLCIGDTYWLTDSTAVAPKEDFQDTIQYTSSLGIDSVLIYRLKVLPSETVMAYDSICRGELYVFPSGRTVVGLDEHVIDTSYYRTDANDCQMIITNLTVEESGKSCEKPFTVTIMPNPAFLGRFVVKSTYRLKRVELYDFTGRAIPIRTETDRNKLEITVSLPEELNGVYILKAFSQDDVRSTKVILE